MGMRVRLGEGWLGAEKCRGSGMRAVERVRRRTLYTEKLALTNTEMSACEH